MKSHQFKETRANSIELRRGNLVNLCFEHKPGWFTATVTDLFNDGSIETDTQELTGKQKYYWEGVNRQLLSGVCGGLLRHLVTTSNCSYL